MDLPSTSKATNQIPADVPEAKIVCTIAFTPNIPNPHYLKQCYLALSEQNELVVPPEVLKAILKTSCQIQFDKLDETLQNVLVDMLQYLLLVWPLWPSVHKTVDRAEINQLYSTFLSYIRQQLNDVVANEKMYREQGKVKVDKSTDTSDLVKRKEEAPFGIIIGGPAFLQSSVMFSVKKDNDDVVLVPYGSKQFPKLALEQLLNWPHVSVYVDFMDVAFVRRNVHEFKRFLCSSELSASNSAHGDVTVPVLYRRSDVGQTSVYSALRNDYLNLYLMELWKKIDMSANPKLYSIIARIFYQFSHDVLEAYIEDNMVGVGTSVCFNIGGQKYRRNRTFLGGNQFNPNKKAYLEEEIVPKLEYTLLKFNAERTDTCPSGFLRLEKNLVNTSGCVITFTCQFCNQIFGGLHGCDMIQKHMENEHTHEYCVYCFSCKRNYGMRELVTNRWKHACDVTWECRENFVVSGDRKTFKWGDECRI